MKDQSSIPWAGGVWPRRVLDALLGETMDDNAEQIDAMMKSYADPIVGAVPALYAGHDEKRNVNQ